MYSSAKGRTFFEPLRHGATEKNKSKTPCLSGKRFLVQPLSDEYKFRQCFLKIRVICPLAKFALRTVTYFCTTTQNKSVRLLVWG